MEIDPRLVKPHLHAPQYWNRLDYEEMDHQLAMGCHLSDDEDYLDGLDDPEDDVEYFD
jgi:hypothetical protein